MNQKIINYAVISLIALLIVVVYIKSTYGLAISDAS